MKHKIFVTINGQTHVTDDAVVVRVYNEALETETDDVGLNFNFTHEGVICDCVENGEVVGTYSETYAEIQENLNE